tara:strand:- start:2440 stop:3174 length:735 start_codon:yes stop_codon:yes gene_type:complete
MINSNKTLNKSNILAVILAKENSMGLKNKNIRLLNKKPLIYWPINAAKKSKFIKKIVVSTDSFKIKKIAEQNAAIVPFMRPKHLSRSDSSSVDCVIHCLDFFKNKKILFDYVVLLEPTSPLTTYKDIDKALRKLHNNRKNSSSIVGVSKNINYHPSFSVKIKKDGKIKPYLDKFKTVRRQSISPLYFFDGTIYISKVDAIIKKKTFYHNKTLAYITHKYQSFEIDDIVDHICVEAVFKNLDKIK